MKNFALVSQLAINVLVPTFMFLALGLWLDEKLGTSWIGVLLLFMGIAAGARNAYMMAISSEKSSKKKSEDWQDIVDRVNKEKK